MESLLIVIISFQVIHMHFWLKRHEICSQIEGWIAELAKLQLTERVDRSMVLRRQYRQLREELAKLPTPPGLEDLNKPFLANVQNAASSSSSTTTTGSTPVETVVTTVTAAPSVPSTTSEASAASTISDQLLDFVTFTELNQPTDSNVNEMEDHGLG